MSQSCGIREYQTPWPPKPGDQGLFPGWWPPTPGHPIQASCPLGDTTVLQCRRRTQRWYSLAEARKRGSTKMAPAKNRKREKARRKGRRIQRRRGRRRGRARAKRERKKSEEIKRKKNLKDGAH